MWRRICLTRLACCENPFPQTSHLYGRSPGTRWFASKMALRSVQRFRGSATLRTCVCHVVREKVSPLSKRFITNQTAEWTYTWTRQTCLFLKSLDSWLLAIALDPTFRVSAQKKTPQFERGNAFSRGHVLIVISSQTQDILNVRKKKIGNEKTISTGEDYLISCRRRTLQGGCRNSINSIAAIKRFSVRDLTQPHLY